MKYKNDNVTVNWLYDDTVDLKKMFELEKEHNKKMKTFKKNGFLELKTNKFEYFRVTGNEDQFGDLKRFCGSNVTITFATCAIDDYWLIELYDSLKEKKVVVPNYDYIVKIDDDEFTVISSSDVFNYFNEVDENKND